MPETQRHLTAATALFALLLLLPTLAQGAWNIVTNPETSNPEATWSNRPSGQSTSDILYSWLDGSSWATTVTLSHQGSNTSSPSLAIDSSGKRAITWETADSTAAIALSTLVSSGGSWSTAVVVSETSESSRAPSVAMLDSTTYIAYEVVPTSGGRLVKVAKTDSSGGIPRTLVRATGNGGALKIKIHQESGHLWMEWIDAAGTLGWSECIDGSWTSAAYAYFESDGEIPATRDAIRTQVVGE